MARQKQRWTFEEEEALRAGVEKYGTSRWKVILSDPQFASLLASRSNIDLKDKWRNLSVSGNANGSREEARTLRLQGPAVNPPLSYPKPLSSVPLLEYDRSAEPSQSLVDKKAAKDKCRALIFEALQSMDCSNGLDVNAIFRFIEERYEVPQYFRRSLTTNLRRLVLGGKLEKVDNCYKIKAASSGAQTSNREDARPNNPNEQNPPKGSKPRIATETLEDAARYAAYAIAMAENSSYAVAEACKEADRLAKLLEENMVMVKLAEELREKCLSSPDGTVYVNP